MALRWIWKHFDALSPHELYEIIVLRDRVFVVEQNCVYLDADGHDPRAWHLCAWSNPSTLVAYMRVLAPGAKYKEHSLGRVITAPEVRGTGLGSELMIEGLKRIHETFGQVPVRISAQQHLERFYGNFGFQSVGTPYDEDGIPHIEMLHDRI